MGFTSTSTTTTLIAKLTPFGRQQLLANKSSLITHFSLGDSDANYNASLPLASGEVPDTSGNLAVNGNTSNSTASGFSPRSVLKYDSIGSRRKLVEIGSTNVINSTALLGQTTVSGDGLTQNVINKNDVSTDSLVNLFYSFHLPISQADNVLFTSTTSEKGGYSDTALSGIPQDNILVIGMDSSEYGEAFDGKTVKIDLTTTGGTGYTMYGAYESTLTQSTVQDANYKETSFNSVIFGNNIAFLFSDTIQKPNNDSSKSWATGYGLVKPYSLGKKSLFNMFTNSITSTVADKVVGVAYLDRGFAVIIDPTIVESFDPSSSGGTGTTMTLDSVVTEITQEITCVANRGEFATSNNPTFGRGDTPRISEIMLLDEANNIIAVAKPDRHIEKQPQQFLALGIKIVV